MSARAGLSGFRRLNSVRSSLTMIVVDGFLFSETRKVYQIQ